VQLNMGQTQEAQLEEIYEKKNRVMISLQFWLG
jgi:flagellar biosynthesis/type III secretory pathway chaperone